MIEPRASVTRFARALVRADVARDGTAHDSEVAQRVVTRLHVELGRLIGPAGLDVLVARSLLLARRAHPVLARITAGPAGTLAGLDDAARDGAALHEGTIALVAHFIELLINLIGEDLAMRLMRDVWPAAAEEEKE